MLQALCETGIGLPTNLPDQPFGCNGWSDGAISLRDPLRKGYVLTLMTTRGQVYVTNLIQGMGWKLLSHAYEGWPQATMNVRHSAIRQRANQYCFGIADLSGELEYFVTPGMAPPATLNGAPCDAFGERWLKSLGSFQNNAMITNEVQGLSRCHGTSAPPNFRVLS